MDKQKRLNNVENLVFDLDGTLLNSKKKINDSTVVVLKELKKHKNIFIATGRPWYFAQKEYNQLNLDTPIMSCNGSLIYHPKLHKSIYKNPFSKEIVNYIYSLLLKYNLTFLIYTEDTMHRFYPKDKSNWIKWQDQENELAAKNERTNFVDYHLESITNFQTFNEEVFKFLIIKSESNSADVELFLDAIKDANVYAVASQNTVVDIMPVGSDKGSAIKTLKELNYINDNVIVFGDASNDLEMFNIAKHSVAMGQSEEYIKSKADFVIGKNDTDAIADFLKENFDI
ncbi:hypothetical protein EI74_0009 [Mycoplasma testudineum]|uniref:Cof subfamily protein (Haloacid dehalogenase superfamily)/HAD superfamily hydrolase (TIGR01484 family) n=2 Tax=Mycoplasma testudineum TaxID=244584 RepID=A0A4R6IJF3_9MOLU|nr:HAD family hydrolase [Mycoplasma testudineum]TDO22152.1 hypothetical protein EI74_0009 [Mycoplasma testudineum]